MAPGVSELPSEIDKYMMKRYMKHASPLGNSQLSYTLKEIKERALLNGNSYGFNQYAD